MELLCDFVSLKCSGSISQKGSVLIHKPNASLD